MMLTKEQFAESFMYLAPDVDIQPMLRFSHVVDTFVFVNLFRTEQEVLRGLEEKLRSLRGALSIVDTGRRFLDRDLDIDLDAVEQIKRPPSWMTAAEQNEYREVFHTALRLPEWGQEFFLERRIGSRVRRLRLLYFTSEALASYLCMSHMGKYPPKYVCTVQTGVIERPSGMFEKMIQDHPRKPALWIRGFAPGGYFYGERGTDNDALAETGEYRFKVQSHGRWFGFDNTLRHVASFASMENPAPGLPDERVIVANNRRVKLVRKDLAAEDVEAYDLVYVSRRLAEKTGIHRHPQVCLWEDCGFHYQVQPQLERALACMANRAGQRGTRKVLMLPVGYEDEGVLFQDWLHDDSIALPESLEVRFRDPMDYVDVRG